jgi:hypothetical protein
VRVLAHVRCTRPEAVTTFGVAVIVAAAVIRPWRRPTPRHTRQGSVLTLILALAVAAAGCGGGGGGDSDTASSDADRPTTTTRIQITAPTPSQVTGPDVTLKVELIGGTVVSRTTGALTPDEGHIHVTVDGKLVAMASTTEQEIKGLSPGPHAIAAEFVAVDHNPFANRPKAAVLFEVAVP